jgi:ribosome-associated protein
MAPDPEEREAPTRKERPSKTRLKREMHDAQALGAQLTALDAARLARLPLAENLRDAIAFARTTTKHEARRRQLQYIGKLMREADVEAIRAAYEDLTGESRASVARMHQCEELRNALLEGDLALSDFVKDHPGVDTQWLNAKIRAARQERAAARPPHHSRELYRWLAGQLEPAMAGVGSADGSAAGSATGAADEPDAGRAAGPASGR